LGQGFRSALRLSCRSFGGGLARYPSGFSCFDEIAASVLVSGCSAIPCVGMLDRQVWIQNLVFQWAGGPPFERRVNFRAGAAGFGAGLNLWVPHRSRFSERWEASVLEAWAFLSRNEIPSRFPHLVPLERFKRLLTSAGSVVPARLVHPNPFLRKEIVLVTWTKP
jgi:hypothetical protein